MRFIAALGLVFALVFSLAIFSQLVDIQADIVALTSGPIQTLAGLFPQVWIFLAGFIGLALLVLAVGLVLR